MPTLAEVQQDIAEARAKLTAASDAYYQMLQQWSLSREGEERLSAFRQARDTAQGALQSAIARLAALGEPKTLIEQVPADSPFLLLPLRLEARYVTWRHMLRDLSPDDLIDTAEMPPIFAFGFGLDSGFQTDDQGLTTYRVPSLHSLVQLPEPAQAILREAAARVPSGRFILRKPDREELWIRIYPDEIFTDAWEKNLLASEEEAGRSFWREVWSGGDAEEAWRRLVDGTTVARAGWIMQATRPTNFGPHSVPDTDPEFPDVPRKDGPYTRAPVARLLPERFVARLSKGTVVKEFVGAVVPEPLPLGLDPTQDPLAADADSGFASDHTVLKAPAALRWIHDLEAAEQAGLAIRVDLAQHPEFRDGVDSIVVLGTKLSVDANEGGRLLEAHFENCLYKEQGLGVLRQGTPTNKTDNQPASQNREMEARRFFRAIWTPPTDPNSDEARLRRALGMVKALNLPDGDARDIEEALLINQLLWPATFGYYLLQFFTPALSESTRERVREFFTRYVSGRGLLPILRVNSQPYGIVPITAFDQWQYGSAAGEEDGFLAELWRGFLSPLNRQWQAMVTQVETEVTKASASHRLDEAFLRMIGMTASSGQFAQHVMIGAGLQNIMRLVEETTTTALTGDASFNPAARASELAAAGLDPNHYKPLIDSYADSRGGKRVEIPVIEKEPLSEERELQRLPSTAWNCLEWLAKAKVENIWKHEFSDAPAGHGPVEGNPDTLLARLARQAVLRTYLETGLQATEPNPGLWLLKVRDFEAEQLHDQPIAVDPAALDPDNVLHQLYTPIVQRFGLTTPFTQEPDRWRYLERMADTLDQPDGNAAFQKISEMKAILTRLARLPTARLQRLLTEHLDLCSHRLDAWLLGLVNQRLEKQRAARPTGIGIGAFGCLLNLTPNSERAVVVVEDVAAFVPATPENLSKAAIPVANLRLARERNIAPNQNWERVFFYLGERLDPGVRLEVGTGRLQPMSGLNGQISHGFLHTPSPSQAVAAAILYSGHLSHKHDTSTDSLAIRLDATRTKRALELLQAVQEGASLAELLGYQLERSLHEQGLDSFLQDIRTKFSLHSASEGTTAARPLTMTDGLAVIEASRMNPVPPVVAAIAPVVREIEDMLDAVGDLLLAESVFQTSKGNTDRAAAALRTLNSGGQVTPPEFVRSPQRGVLVNHRVGIVFDQKGPGEPTNVWAAAGVSPRAVLAPALNRWLARQFPAPGDIAIAVTLSNGTQTKLTMTQLSLEPIDFLHACPEAFAEAQRSPLALAAAVKAREFFSIEEDGAMPALRVDLQRREGFGNNELSVFEVSAQAACLRKLVADCRPMEAGDFRLPGTSGAGNPQLDPARGLAALNAFRASGGSLDLAIEGLRQATETLAAASASEPLEIRRAGERVHAALLQAWLHGGTVNRLDVSSMDRNALLETAATIATDLEQRRTALRVAMDSIPNDLAGAPLVHRLAEAAATVFGSSVRVLPDVRIDNAVEIQDAIAGHVLLENASPGHVDKWLQEAAMTRQPLRVYRRAMLLREALQTADAAVNLAIIQLPFRTGRSQPWIGGPFSADAAPEDLALTSLALEVPVRFATRVAFSGMILDEWPEFVPSKMANTGVALHYNQPNSEPPQVMLLAVTPVEGTTWRWEYLMGAVLEALQLARKRLVTPAHLARQSAALGHVLPAVMIPATPGGSKIPNMEVD